MENTVAISCKVGNTDVSAELGLEVWLDEACLLDLNHVTSTCLPVTLSVSDEDGDHELRFVLKNKLSRHTVVDADGNIVTDARLTIKNVTFDGIELGQIFIDNAVYTHDFNGTGTLTQQKFYGEMGCNGTAVMKFTTPMYVWMLENM